MNYISAEEFLKQSDEVKDTFKNWLEENLQEKDWVRFIEEETDVWVESVLDTRKDKINVGRVFYLGKCLCWSCIHDPNIVPLFKEGQLIKFIEDNKLFIEFNNFGFNKGKQQVCVYKDLGQTQTTYFKEDESLLQALWEVAIGIAKSN